MLVFLLCSVAARAQKSVLLRFEPRMNNEPLKLYEGEASGQLQVTMLRCYISGVSLWKDGKKVWQESNSYHLLDAEAPASLAWSLTVPLPATYDAIHFCLGIDSATSSSGAHGGDLDPAKGMYWAWQSGYVNFKLEGVSPQSTARKHQFHFHLGGYQAPYGSVQDLILHVRSRDTISVRMELDKFLSGIGMSKQNSIMIPGADAYELSKKAASIFYAP